MNLNPHTPQSAPDITVLPGAKERRPHALRTWCLRQRDDLYLSASLEPRAKLTEVGQAGSSEVRLAEEVENPSSPRTQRSPCGYGDVAHGVASVEL